MRSITQRLADVRARMDEIQTRIAEYQSRIEHGDCEDAALAATLLYSAACALRELRSHKARLDTLDGDADPSQIKKASAPKVRKPMKSAT